METEIDENWINNDTSFDAFIKNTIGSTDERNLKSGNQTFIEDIERPSFGGEIQMLGCNKEKMRN